MGVKNFTKVFPLEETNKVTFGNYNGKIVVVDAMIELYRSMLGIKNRQTLTDKHGRPTIHISVILCLILDLYKNKVKQIWCFDSHNEDKIDELEQRKVQRDKAQTEFDKIDDDIAFLDGIKEAKKDSLRKRLFIVEDWMITDIKFMLDCFGITWLDAPESYESEHLAACLTKNGIADAVLTTDVDTLLFGAKEIIKRDMRRGKKKKEYYKYNLAKLLKKYKLSQDDLIKIGICLGNDFILKGIPGIGPKTVLSKFNIVDEYLADPDSSSDTDTDSDADSDADSSSDSDTDSDSIRDQVLRAYTQFTKECPIDSNKKYVSNMLIDINSYKIKNLLEWLSKEKGYNIDRRKKLIMKAIEYRKGKKRSKK